MKGRRNKSAHFVEVQHKEGAQSSYYARTSEGNAVAKGLIDEITTMLTKNALRISFKVYLDMLDGCAKKGLYWPALHILVIIPDICGALESETGGATPPAYKDWCRRYILLKPLLKLGDLVLDEDEWYEIRCKLLHQGRAVVQRGRYKGYKFTLPDKRGNMAHTNILGSELNLDVSALIEHVKQGLNNWFIDIAGNKYPDKSANVEKNLPSLLRVVEGGKGLEPYIGGTGIPVLGSI